MKKTNVKKHLRKKKNGISVVRRHARTTKKGKGIGVAPQLIEAYIKPLWDKYASVTEKIIKSDDPSDTLVNNQYKISQELNKALEKLTGQGNWGMEDIPRWYSGGNSKKDYAKLVSIIKSTETE